VAVGSDATIAGRWSAGRTLDARKRFLIPGLWDMHVHFGGGPVEPGKAADLVILDRNPLQDNRATQAIHAVILRGTVHDRTALDRMLADTRAKVAAWNDAEARKP
jgi:imidazolonepropionase-like amidohydrolase